MKYIIRRYCAAIRSKIVCWHYI